MFRKALLGALVGVLAATAFALPAAAQEYVVGVTAALTGPPSSTYAPAVDAMRLYIDRVNAAGGVNGRKIRLVIEDDGAQPSKAAANTKKLITQDNVVLMVNASLSSTYAPVIAETKSAEVPLLFASGVCPQSVYPPADPLQFCTTGYASHFDSQATLDFIKATAKGPVKIGFSAMASALARQMDYAWSCRKVGMSRGPGGDPAADRRLHALRHQAEGCRRQLGVFLGSVGDAGAHLRGAASSRLEDDYIAWGHLEAEAELVRLKDGKFYVINSNALFQDDLPIQKEIDAAAKQAGSKYPAQTMTEGWIGGMAIEAALKAAGASADRAKLRGAMENLTIDTKGLRGGPIVWTKDNHFRTQLYYRVYKWDGSKISRVQDWKNYAVK
jgi:ABC-type branched-subunit amino acid transport system substrate-binding protein